MCWSTVPPSVEAAYSMSAKARRLSWVELRNSMLAQLLEVLVFRVKRMCLLSVPWAVSLPLTMRRAWYAKYTEAPGSMVSDEPAGMVRSPSTRYGPPAAVQVLLPAREPAGTDWTLPSSYQTWRVLRTSSWPALLYE